MVAFPVQVTFHNMERSDFVEADVQKKVAELATFSDNIMSCRVVVEAPHRRRKKGKVYTVRVDLSVVGDELVVTHKGPLNHAHEDVYVAIRDAFRAAGRRLQDYEAIRRGKVKTHETPAHGKVVTLFPEYGFVETSDGQEIYFHRNSVVGAKFDSLEAGDEVRLEIVHDESAKGPQASTVVPLGKRHLVQR